VPERDGIYASLLVAEMVAVEGATLDELARRLYARHGHAGLAPRPAAWRERTRVALQRLLARKFASFAGQPVTRVDRGDGVLLELEDGSWCWCGRREPRRN